VGGTAVRTRQTPVSPAAAVDARVLQDRDHIRVALQSLPAGSTRQVLQAMDDRRGARRAGHAGSALPQDINLGEMQREIVWRLDTLPPEDAKAIAALVRQLVRRP